MWLFKKKEVKPVRMRWIYRVELWYRDRLAYTVSMAVEHSEETLSITEKGREDARKLLEDIRRMWKTRKYIDTKDMSIRSSTIDSLLAKFEYTVIGD